MNIDDLTIAQAKQLVAMLGGVVSPAAETRTPGHGRRVIVRSRDAGVLVGDLGSYTATEVVLLDARQMWSWHAAQGGTLLDCATYGVKPDKCKFSGPNDRVVVLGACALINVTEAAAKTMENVKW